ncbi:hypothetical protein FQA39_LY00222 [Lamprigera yunnana]|nr:hypothetical protein FQA39_LY00222 [Lamprigera yunnana]
MNLSSGGKENKVQSVFAEVELLRAVLDLKQNQLGESRKLLAEAKLLLSTAEKVSLLTARCEDLECQLESKCLYEQQLLGENKKLQESLKEELHQTTERSLANKSYTSADGSLRNRKSKNSCDLDFESPTSSPKVKGVVEKSYSVSYVLEME